MAYENLKLIKCFRFDKDEQRWGMCDEWVSKYSDKASGLHTFSYDSKLPFLNKEAYAVTTDYSAHGQSDGVDSEHYDNIYVYLYPIPIEDAEDEEKVKAVVENTECVYSGSFDASQIHLYNESYYTDSIMWPVFYAIDAYKSSIKKKEIQIQVKKDEITVAPNAVKVYKEEGLEPDPRTILDFDSNTTLAEQWYLGEPCSSVGVDPMHGESMEALGIDRPLCYFYPISGSFGHPSVHAYIRHNGEKRIIVHFPNWWDTGNSAVICAYVNERPAPLTAEEVKKILNFAKDGGE